MPEAILIAVVLLATLVLSAAPVLQAAGGFLGPQDPLQAADAVIAISGNNPERVNTAARILLGGYAQWLILSGGPEPIAQMTRMAVALGVPPARILTDKDAFSTVGNALGSARVMAAHGLQSAILVTSPYHMRRAIVLFRAVFHRQGLTVRSYPAQPSIFRADGWWRRPRDRQFVLAEYAKLLALVLGFR